VRIPSMAGANWELPLRVDSFLLPLAIVELGLETSGKRRAADLRRSFHDDEASAFQMLHEALGDDLRHDLVCIVDALAPVKTQCEGKRGG
jgi:hypothetical protein